MKLSTPNLFVNRGPKNLRLTETSIEFPEYWIAKRDLIIRHQYNDDTEIKISINKRGVYTDISYRGREYSRVRTLDQSLLRWALSP